MLPQRGLVKRSTFDEGSRVAACHTSLWSSHALTGSIHERARA